MIRRVVRWFRSMWPTRAYRDNDDAMYSQRRHAQGDTRNALDQSIGDLHIAISMLVDRPTEGTRRDNE